jgi:hypothetical protein
MAPIKTQRDGSYQNTTGWLLSKRLERPRFASNLCLTRHAVLYHNSFFFGGGGQTKTAI